MPVKKAAKKSATERKEKVYFSLCNGVQIEVNRLNRAVEKNGKVIAKAQKKVGAVVKPIPSLYSKKDDPSGATNAAGEIKQVNDKLLYKDLDGIGDEDLKVAVTGALNLLLAGKL